MLTPGYASPEQVRGELIGTSSDIYSLGVVFYELLAGQRPYAATGAPPEVLALGPPDPERPSTAVERAMRGPDTATAEMISQARGLPPEKLCRRLSGDLDVICLKALRAEPERRYGSVEAFSEDIQRHRTGLPVMARPDTAGYRMRKFIQRHRAGVAISAAVLLLVAALVGFYVDEQVRVEQAAEGFTTLDPGAEGFSQHLVESLPGEFGLGDAACFRLAFEAPVVLLGEIAMLADHRRASTSSASRHIFYEGLGSAIPCTDRMVAVLGAYLLKVDTG